MNKLKDILFVLFVFVAAFIIHPVVLIILIVIGVLFILYPVVIPDQSDPQDKPSGTNPFMSAKDKSAYLKSTKYRKLRNQILERDNYKCQSCNADYALNVHHITYKRLGNELPEDLVTLCEKCHTELHNKLGYDRTTDYPIK